MEPKKTNSLPAAAILLGTMGVAIKPEGYWCTVELISLSICMATVHGIKILYKIYKRKFLPLYHKISWLMVIILLPLLGSFLSQLKYNNGNPSGSMEDCLISFIAVESKNEEYERPVGVAVLKDGSLLVADDSGNTI